MHTPDCSIVIRAYNEEEHIGRLLAGILEQSIHDPEIILVDSGSTDATVSIASRFPVRVISISPEEFSFGRALNRGISQTQAAIVVMASAHIYPVYADWLERLLAPFEDPRMALTYGRQRGGETTRFSEHQIFAKWFPSRSASFQNHAFCNNANAAIRRELWEEHHYDEELPGLEDLEWAAWALSSGYGLSYVAEAEVIHVHDEHPSQVFNRYRREAMAMREIFPAEQFGLADFLWLFGSNVLSDFWHASREGEALRSWIDILRFRFLQFWGTYQGFRLSGPLSSKLKRVFYYPRTIGHRPDVTDRSITPIDYAAKHGSTEEEREVVRDA